MISISIVSHAQNALVNQLLKSLTEVETELAFEILVTENLRDDIQINEEVPGSSLRILRNRSPQGFAKNQNAALQQARGDFSCVLNPDTRWVEPLFTRLRYLIESEIADVVAPLVVDEQDNLQDSFRDLPTPLSLLRRRLGKHTGTPSPFVLGEINYPDWIAGIFLLMRTETYRQLGGFDERFHLYFEDVDICSRARLAGLVLAVDTGCRIVHEARRASKRSPRHFYWHLVSAGRFFTSPVYWQSRSMRHASK
jgi:N-acetylglucosaminyl-diphospho-decaprenol L-rhamnosyltransferase